MSTLNPSPAVVDPEARASLGAAPRRQLDPSVPLVAECRHPGSAEERGVGGPPPRTAAR